jgi:hypothetical protein
MSAHITYEHEALIRYPGVQASAIRLVVVPGLPLLAFVAVFYVAGWHLDVGFVLFLLAFFCLPVGIYMLSWTRNQIVLGSTDVRVMYFMTNPLKERVIAYDSITEIEAHEDNNELDIKFVNEAGEHDMTGILLKDVSPGTVRDQILARQSIDRLELPDQAEPLVFDVSEVPNGDEEKRFEVRRFGQLVLKADRVVMRAGLGDDRHRIYYRDIIEANGYDPGYVVVKYNKRPKLGLGGGEGTAQVRLKHHPDAAVAAALIRAGTKRDKQHR